MTNAGQLAGVRLWSREMSGKIMRGREANRFVLAGMAELKRAVDETRRADTAKLVAGCRMNVRIPMDSPDLARNKANTQKEELAPQLTYSVYHNSD